MNNFIMVHSLFFFRDENVNKFTVVLTVFVLL